MFDNNPEVSMRQQNISLADDSDGAAEVDDTPVAKPKQRKLGPILDDDESPLKPKAKKTPSKGKRAAESSSEVDKQSKVNNINNQLRLMNCS